MIYVLSAEKKPFPLQVAFGHSNRTLRQIDRNWTTVWTIAMIHVAICFFNLSIPSYIISQLQFPLPPLLLPVLPPASQIHSSSSISLRQRAGPRDINGTCIMSYNKTGCISLYKGWTRQPRRRKEVLGAAERDRDTLLLPLLGVLQEDQATQL